MSILVGQLDWDQLEVRRWAGVLTFHDSHLLDLVDHLHAVKSGF